MTTTKIKCQEYRWDVITGCLQRCNYCHAENKAFRDKDNILHTYRWEPAPVFHKEKLSEPKTISYPCRIFVGNMGDVFGSWILHKWIYEILQTAAAANKHTYMFITKNPERYKKELYQWNKKHNRLFTTEVPRINNWMFGTAVENQSTANERIPELLNIFGIKRFLSIEPLLGPIDLNKIEQKGKDAILDVLKGEAIVPFTILKDRPKVHWIIVGAQTGLSAVGPKKEWIESLINQARETNVPIFLKDNLNWPVKIQEYPK